MKKYLVGGEGERGIRHISFAPTEWGGIKERHKARELTASETKNFH